MKSKILVAICVLGWLGWGFFVSYGQVVKSRDYDALSARFSQMSLEQKENSKCFQTTMHPSTPDEFFQAIKQLAEIAEKGHERSVMAAAGVLYAVAGSLKMSEAHTIELFEAILPVLQKQSEEARQAIERENAAKDNRPRP